jgi:hypothetical protein
VHVDVVINFFVFFDDDTIHHPVARIIVVVVPSTFVSTLGSPGESLGISESLNVGPRYTNLVNHIRDRMKRIWIYPIGVIYSIFSAEAFSARLAIRTGGPRKSLISILAEGYGDFDDVVLVGDEGASAEGEALAREFYKQLKQRTENDENVSGGRPSTITTEGARSLNRQYILHDQVDASATDDVKPRKFTGRMEDMNSAGLFSGRGASVYSVPSPYSTAESPQQRMMKNEFELIGRGEQLFWVQALATLSFLILAVVIGITGGITSNDWSSLPDSVDTNMEGLDEVIPLPTDSETSIWL